jgi:hypothetical protein
MTTKRNIAILVGICAAQGDHQAFYRFGFAVFGDGSVAGQAAGRDGRNVAHPDDTASASANNDGSEVIGRANCTNGANNQCLVTKRETTRAVIAVARFNGRFQIFNGQPGCGERVAIGAHFKGFNIAAQRVDIGNAGHGAQHGPDRPIERAAFFGKALRAFHREHVHV